MVRPRIRTHPVRPHPSRPSVATSGVVGVDVARSGYRRVPELAGHHVEPDYGIQGELGNGGVLLPEGSWAVGLCSCSEDAHA